MRVLVWPTYSYAGNVGADSLYLIARNLLRTVTTGHWSLVVPERGTPDDELDGITNVSKIAVPMPVLYRMQETMPDPEILRRFSPTDGWDPADVLVSMSPARTLAAKATWSARCPETARQAFVNYDLLVRDDRSGEIKSDDVELLLQAAGAAAADVNVHESPMAELMTRDIARKYLSPTMVRRVMADDVAIPQGISITALDAAIAGVPKRSKFAVYYGGRFSTSKRVNDLADVIDAFYRFGRDVQFVVTTGSLDGNKRAKFVERFPEVELHVGLSQDDAWRVMASCHASVCFSTHELFGMAFWEQMAAGLSVVMLAARWNHDLLPPDYPRVAQSPLHAASLLRTEHTVWRNGGLQGVDSEYAKFVRRMYDADSNMKRLRDLVMERAERLQWTASLQYDAGSRRELKALVRQVLPDCGAAEMMPLWEFWHLLRGQSRVGHNVVGARMKWAKSNATLDAVRIARTLGWHDAKGPDGEPVLVNGGV